MLSLSRRTFLKSKVMDLRQALFFSDSYSVLKFPVSIVTVLDVDDVGQIWFLVRRPAQHINEFEKEIRARLALYKKGKEFYLNVTGRAYLVTDPEEITHADGIDTESKKLAVTTMVLIRMCTTSIEYSETPKPLQWPSVPKFNLQPSAFVKSLQDVVKNIIPVFQSH